VFRSRRPILPHLRPPRTIVDPNFDMRLQNQRSALGVENVDDQHSRKDAAGAFG
jgi:hypothetical protein